MLGHENFYAEKQHSNKVLLLVGAKGSRKIALETACNRGMAFKDTQGHHNRCF